MELPVYLFTGFLEAGKTRFIQETLEDPKFNEGERMLVLLCEEGEVELDTSKMPGGGGNITVTTFDAEDLLTQDRLKAAQKRARADRVLVEYNGMWNIDSIYRALPEGWFVCEEVCLFDASTVTAYNQNMRQLVYDKLKSPQMVIFNRCDKDTDTDALHKLVRAVSRRSGIGYEYLDGSFVPDETEDPLPFDLAKDPVVIDEKDYALWYSHMSENMEMYEGKTVRFLGMIGRDPSMPGDTLVVGRQIMTCCEADIAFRPVVAKYRNASGLTNGEWYLVTGKVRIEDSPYYQSAGPVLYISSITPAQKPENPVATFY